MGAWLGRGCERGMVYDGWEVGDERVVWRYVCSLCSLGGRDGRVRCGGCPFARWWAGEALLDVYIRTHIDT